MDRIRDEKLKQILSELAGLLYTVYGNRLRSVILYGSVARGTETAESDIDIMVLIDGDESDLREFSDQLCDVSTEMALKYLKVFSIIDVSYQEYIDWKQVSPFYKNVSTEGIELYAA